MKVENRIHCGHVICTKEVNGAVLTETRHEAGSRLDLHAHSLSHVAVLLEGSYFERIGSECFLRLPGDRVDYPQFFEHENRFGRLPSRCLNIESDQRLNICEDVAASELARTTRNLAEIGKVRCLSAAAKHLGYHPVYISRVFRKSYGVSLGEFIKTCRVRRSAQMLFKSSLSLGEIAALAGYYDQSHLTNEMASLAGFTPAELRRLAAN